MAYTPVGWKNYPSKDTPLSAENLKKMDDGILENSQGVEGLKTEVAALKKSVSDGKKTVAAAITAEGVSTAADATFAVMAANVGKVADNQYSAGTTASKKGTATAADVLAGKTFTNASTVGAAGTMTNRGAWTSATSGSGNVAIPAGYHNGKGYVSGSGAYNAGYKAGQSAGGAGKYKVAYTSVYMNGNTLMNVSYGKTFSSVPTVVAGSNSGSEVKSTIPWKGTDGCQVGSSDPYATVYVVAFGN